ncbi:hypothetical protein JCM9279_002931 [Rhodotorula babjevae]
MATPDAKCTVCQEPATMRCSACSREPFCGRSCQALLWPSHKVLCKRDPTVFYLPPLRADQIQTLREVQDKPLRQGQRLIDEVASVEDGEELQQSMEYFYKVVGLKGPLDKLNLEHERLEYLLVGNEFLDLVRKGRIASTANGEDPSDAPATPWEVLGEMGNLFYDEYFDAVVAEGRDDQEEAFRNRTGQGFFNKLNGVLRCELVKATLRAVWLRPEPPLTVMELHLKELRCTVVVREELERADLPPRVRDRIKAKYERLAHVYAQAGTEYALLEMFENAQREALERRARAQAP